MIRSSSSCKLWYGRDRKLEWIIEKLWPCIAQRSRGLHAALKNRLHWQYPVKLSWYARQQTTLSYRLLCPAAKNTGSWCPPYNKKTSLENSHRCASCWAIPCEYQNLSNRQTWGVISWVPIWFLRESIYPARCSPTLIDNKWEYFCWSWDAQARSRSFIRWAQWNVANLCDRPRIACRKIPTACSIYRYRSHRSPTDIYQAAMAQISLRWLWALQ